MTASFTQRNEAIVTFFDQDGYAFKLTVPDARDETDARERAHAAARERIRDGQWRPHGTLLIGGLQINPTTTQTRPRDNRYAAAAAWRSTAATHLQAAIAELEQAAITMPVSRERVMVDRALRATAQTFRECTRNLALALRHLGAETADTPRTTRGAER
ncbi:MAG: hypothetical protein ACLP0J_09515 [Solirubrobacteraceae bacterium]|jgi:hypothetical protein